MEELAGLLARERRLLEVVVFKLVELRQLLSAGEARFLPWAADEVERAAGRLREAELHRALVVNRLAEAAGMSDEDLSLRALARTAPAPYAGIFADHRRALLLLTGEVERTVAECRALCADGAALVAEVLERVTAGGGRLERAAGAVTP